ncbi:Gfo/Idh/MocA family oxidoreductase [Qipengyuania sp. DSG2-2]|uniref:Gfo/Idh/MocA family oxidoreductase n=1 Tax=Qipengyuania sp. DGS2-2 TaxID=3349631 RepID=UPI0036D24E1F
MSQTTPIPCAILGAGRIGWSYDGGAWDGQRSVSHAACYDRHPATQLVAVYEPDAAARAAFSSGYRGSGEPVVTGDLEEVLALSPECVSVCSPSEHHAAHIERLLDTDARFLWVEKPVTLALADHEALLEKWRGLSNPPRIGVNYLRRGLPQYAALQAAAADLAPIALNATYSRGLAVNGVHILDQIGAVLDVSEAPELDWIEASDPDNPSFGFRIGSTRVTITGMDLPYHCIEISAVFADRRLSVVRGGLGLREELAVPNPDYPGFRHLAPATAHPDAQLHCEAMLDGTYRNLEALLDTDSPLPSTLETSLFAASLMDRVTRATQT